MTEALQFPSDRSADLPPLVGGRFRPRERIDIRGSLERWSADETAGVGPVVLLSEPLHSRPDPSPAGPPWPSLAWEEDVRRRLGLGGLAQSLDRFAAAERDFLVLATPPGVTLWE